MPGTIAEKTKGKVKERPKDGRELVPLVEGSYFTHHLSNVVCMHNVHGKAKVWHTPCVYMNQKLGQRHAQKTWYDIFLLR